MSLSCSQSLSSCHFHAHSYFLEELESIDPRASQVAERWWSCWGDRGLWSFGDPLTALAFSRALMRHAHAHAHARALFGAVRCVAMARSGMRCNTL